MGSGSAAVAATRRQFPAERLHRIEGAAEHHFWHLPRRRLVLDLIERSGAAARGSVLDAGCGDGSLVEDLAARGLVVTGLDPWVEEFALDPRRFRVGTLTDMPWADSTFGSVCALDVLEHVDDTAAVSEIVRVLRPGGLLIVTVPAHRWLWSARDHQAGHLRRYTRATLRAVLERGGFRVEKLFGYGFALLPLAMLTRCAARCKEAPSLLDVEDRPPRWLNTMLLAVNLGEVGLGRVIRPPTGSSLVAVSRLHA